MKILLEETDTFCLWII